MTHHHAHATHTGPSGVLDAEHHVIEHLLKAMDSMADALDHGRPVPLKDVEDVLEVASGFADKCHHAKEERILFPALMQAQPKRAKRVVDELTGDHKAGRKLIGSMRGLAVAAAKGEPREEHRLAYLMRLYTTVLDAHIRHEETRLLPLVDSVFTPGERAKLAEAFERVEREETGEGAHERYEGMVHRLRETYA